MADAAENIQKTDAVPVAARPSVPVGFWQKTRGVFKEIWDDHKFWLNTIAVKGWASAIVVTGVVGISSVIALPFLAAAAGIALCGGLIALGLYGVGTGAATAWGKLKEAYYKGTGQPVPETHKQDDGPTLLQKLQGKPWAQKIAHHKMTEKLLNSRVWKTTEKLTKNEAVLGGFAIGGSFASMAIGVTLLATQLLVLPVIALTSLLTFTVVMAVSSTVSGVIGLCIGTGDFVRSLRKKKDNTEPAGEKPAPSPVTEEPAGGATLAQTAALKDSFAAGTAPEKEQAPAQKQLQEQTPKPPKP